MNGNGSNGTAGAAPAAATSESNGSSKPAAAALVSFRETDFPALPPSFGPEIYGAISEVLGPSDDPLDSPSFSVVEYVNSLFPNGAYPPQFILLLYIII
jgi:hypothetical protein